MSKDYSREWIKAVMSYSNNPNELILCPVCGKEYLTITPAEKDSKVLDIYFQCGACKAHNIMAIATSHQEKVYQAIHSDKFNSLTGI